MKRDFDFLRSYRARNKQSQKKGGGIRRIAVIVVAANLIVAVAACGVIFFQQSRLAAQRDELTDYLNNSADAQAYAALVGKQGDYETLHAYNQAVAAATAIVQHLPDFTRDHYNLLVNNLPSGMSLIGLDFASGYITANYSARSSEAIPTYVERLKNSDKFLAVGYNAWQQQSAANTAVNAEGEGVTTTTTDYLVTVRCVLRGVNQTGEAPAEAAEEVTAE